MFLSFPQSKLSQGAVVNIGIGSTLISRSVFCRVLKNGAKKMLHRDAKQIDNVPHVSILGGSTSTMDMGTEDSKKVGKFTISMTGGKVRSGELPLGFDKGSQ